MSRWFVLLTNLVFAIVVFLYIPLLFVPNWAYEFFTIYHPDWFRGLNSHENHKLKVQRVQEQVKQWNRNGRKKKMCTARPTWKSLAVRDLDKRQFTQINLDLDDIIEIDIENKVIKLEPGIQMGTLTYKLLNTGWTIPVVPELETLTVGGLINGAGLESSSHKYGLFADTCIEFELVLADGSIANCSKDEISDLFLSIPMSYGTLGFLTSVTIPLIPAGKYVKLEYRAVSGVAQAEALLRNAESEFIEAIAFGKDDFVVTHGSFTDNPEPGTVNYINRWYKPWFYQHMEGFLKTVGPTVEHIPTRDYYHRHTRGVFWLLSIASITRTRVFMILFGWLFPFNYQFMKWVLPNTKWMTDWSVQKVICQDFVFPMNNLAEVLTFCHNLVEIYPVWLCPYNNAIVRPGLIRVPRDVKDYYYIDIGIYGMLSSKKMNELGSPAEAVRKLEQYAIENKGFQGMYSDCYLSKEDFYQMFDGKMYNRLRSQLCCEDAFPDVYEKISISHKKNG